MIEDENLVKKPLPTLFSYSMYSTFTGIGSLIVSGFLPVYLRVLVPATLITTRSYQIINEHNINFY